MILYRALNEMDIKNLKEHELIYCTMYNHRTQLKNKHKWNKSDINCYNDFKKSFGKTGKIANTLDTIIGHIQGQRLKSNNSPWVSTSTNLDYVITEYAVPQAGNYNTQNMRKPIALIDFDDNLVLDTVEKISSIRNSEEDFKYAIDLRKGKLNEYVDNSAVNPASTNPELSSYNAAYTANRKKNKKHVKGFAGYATTASEVLVNKVIGSDDIALIIPPIVQDIIYGCNYKIKDIEECKVLCNLIKELYYELSKNNPFLQVLYPTYDEGINLTDYLYNYYDNIKGSTIEEKYHTLKREKIMILSYISSMLNMNFTRLVDEKVLALSSSKTDYIKDTRIYDVVLIEKAGSLYRYNHKTNHYVNEKKLIYTPGRG